MKKHYFLFFTLLGLLPIVNGQTTIPIYNNVTFYDGYAGIVAFPTQPDVVRLRNDLFTKKLTSNVLDQIGTTLQLNIVIGALCDNYDRIANVNIALVPKGALSYDPASVNRIELARFITPFMNKNIEPSSVPYTFTVNNVAEILKDDYLYSIYDFWIELEVFGVPYAANTQVAGCAGRNDVFLGKLDLVTNTDTPFPNNTFLLPLNFKKNLNNYAVGASDAIGTTTRTINFDLASQINNAKFYLITSNHGANTGGEEYNRRWHYIYLDSNLILDYKPGELTCEPYRVYNTQGNGIYGPSPRTPAQWQSFSNWCPGSKILIREIELGDLSAGSHQFKIEVPAAVFVGGQGDIPVSLYLQGENTVLNIDGFTPLAFDYFPNPTKNTITIKATNTIISTQLFDVQGRLLQTSIENATTTVIDISQKSSGIYFLKVISDTGSKVTKIIKE